MTEIDFYELDRNHFWHPWRAMNKLTENTIFVKGKGCYVTSIEGKKYFDAASAALNASCGYGQKEIINPIYTQLETLMNIDTIRFSSLPPIKLAKKLADLLPNPLNRTFFCTSGSEATETAMKIARMYCSSVYGDQKFNIISFRQGYHGTTLLPLAASENEFAQKGNEPLPSGFFQIDAPFCKDCKEFREHEVCNIPPAKLLEDKINELGSDNIAAFIMEPILGIGGLIIPSEEYIRYIADVCKENRILLIFDETMTSLGRTGKLFGFEHSGVVPDILVTGKGISGGYFPLSAITTTEDIYKEFSKDQYLGGFRHGHTNSGHAVGCAAAIATIDFVINNDLVENARQMGELILSELSSIFEKHNNVKEVRGKGLVVGFNLKNVDESEMFAKKCFERGLIVRQIGSCIGLFPPLIITEQEVNEITTIIREVYESLEN